MPTYLLLGIFAGWLNRHQQAIIEYLRTENEILKRQLHGRRPRLTDGERRLLAVKGKALGRKVLEAVACIVTPDTILAWHRRLIAVKWTFPRRTQGRPATSNEVGALIVEMARTEPRWGYTSIRDRLRNLGHRVSRATVAKILKAHGWEPAPKRSRGNSWSAFLKAHWAGIAAMDFTTVEVWTTGGLVTHDVAFVMELATRKVICAGITPHPDAAWIQQIGRNLTDAVSGFLVGKRFLIMDRDTVFHEHFRGLLAEAGVRPVWIAKTSSGVEFVDSPDGSVRLGASCSASFLPCFGVWEQPSNRAANSCLRTWLCGTSFSCSTGTHGNPSSATQIGCCGFACAPCGLAGKRPW
jgi:hypothetical protein